MRTGFGGNANTSHSNPDSYQIRKRPLASDDKQRRKYRKQQRRAATRSRKQESVRKAEAKKRQRPPEHVKVFCDEAGNTGANYLDEDQPFYVLAGWIVPGRVEAEWTRRIDAIAAQWASPELHANKLWKHNRGKRLLLGVIEAGLKSGCAPVLSVADKRACLALRFIDAVLDPITNPSAGWLPFQRNSDRKVAAQAIARAVPETLAAFGQVLVAADPLAWDPVIVDIVAGLHTAAKAGPAHSDAELLLRIAASVEVGRAHLHDITQYERREDKNDPSTRRNVAMSLNLPTFVQFTQMVDDVLAHRLAEVELIHDKTRQFEKSFAHVAKTNAAIGRVHLPMPLQSGEHLLLGTGTIASFRTADSASERGIQAADALATCACNIAKLSLARQPLDGVDAAIAAAVYALGFASRVTQEPTGLDHFVGFDDDWAELGEIVLQAQKTSGWPEGSPALNGECL